MSKNGLILLTPTSISSNSGLSTINPNGSISVVSDQYLRINGLFSADYDNYMVVSRINVTSLRSYSVRMAVGSAIDGGTNYWSEYMWADGSTVGAARYNQSRFVFPSYNTSASGSIFYFYGPYLEQPTAARAIGVDSRNDCYLNDAAATHTQSVSYDGLYFYDTTQPMTGTIAVYGMRK